MDRISLRLKKRIDFRIQRSSIWGHAAGTVFVLSVNCNTLTLNHHALSHATIQAAKTIPTQAAQDQAFDSEIHGTGSWNCSVGGVFWA